MIARVGILALLLVLTFAAAVQSCAFPKQACLPEVCDSLDVLKLADLLNPKTSLLFPNETFDPNDKSSKGDWASADFIHTLGYFFGVYNPKYNGGKFSADKWAVRDKAPSLNYLSFRNSFGDEVADTGVTMAECCNLCRTKENCIIWQFNPYVISVEDDNGNDIGRTWDDGTGDCYYIYPNSKANSLSKVNKRCSNTTGQGFFSSSTKPTFYGGICNAEVADDPHFVGARGTRYDFNGALDKSFCLLADSRLQMNTLLRGYSDPAGGETGLRSWMKEMGFVWADASGQRHTLQLVARGGKQQERGDGFLAAVALDGAQMPVPSLAGAALSQGDLTLTFLGTRRTGPYEVDSFALKIGDLLDLSLSLRVAHPKLQTPQDAEVHFNMVLNSIQATENIHGVLGQTYRQTASQQMKAVKYSILSRILGAPVQADGQTGKGFLEGEVADYVTSSVTTPDCKFSSM